MDFLRIILMKAMREEKLLFSIASYVGQQQGNDFKEPRPWRLEDVFHGTSARSPVVFVLTTGADPTAMLQRFGESKGWLPGERLHMISLGQGQVLHTLFFWLPVCTLHCQWYSVSGAVRAFAAILAHRHSCSQSLNPQRVRASIEHGS